jgi:purine-nucleoside phosphorylase
VHGVRMAAAAGCRVIILTNACGGLRAGMAIGDVVVISDHLNLSWQSPLHGADFVDLTELYSPRLRALVHEIDPSATEGVYAMFRGPQYETPAEVRMAAALGADLVGMSTVLEAIAARAAGTEILGLSLVTNLAAGITGQPLTHQEVLDAGRAAAARMGDLLGEVIERL